MKLIIGLVLLMAWFLIGEKIGQRMESEEYQCSRDVIELAKESRRKARAAAHRVPRYATYCTWTQQKKTADGGHRQQSSECIHQHSRLFYLETGRKSSRP